MSNNFQSHKDLIVWQKSMDLVYEIYILTNKFPKSELYGIISQMRRASISIPSNIAEGWGRKTHGQYAQYFLIANGSALELETQILLSKRLELAPEKDFQPSGILLNEVLRMLNKMTGKSRTSS
jgi:four helix bundle protein